MHSAETRSSSPTSARGLAVSVGSKQAATASSLHQTSVPKGSFARAGKRDGVLVAFHLFQGALGRNGAFGHLQGFQGIVIVGATGSPSGPAAHGGQCSHAGHAVKKVTARQQKLMAPGQGEGCGLFCSNAPRGRGSSLWHGAIVSFRIHLGDRMEPNATINANTTTGLIYVPAADKIAGQHRFKLGHPRNCKRVCKEHIP